MKPAVNKWVHGLGSAIVTGLATSFLSALGISGSNVIGIKIEQLSAKQIAVVTLLGGLVGMFAYLKQSPLPSED